MPERAAAAATLSFSTRTVICARLYKLQGSIAGYCIRLLGSLSVSSCIDEAVAQRLASYIHSQCSDGCALYKTRATAGRYSSNNKKRNNNSNFKWIAKQKRGLNGQRRQVYSRLVVVARAISTRPSTISKRLDPKKITDPVLQQQHRLFIGRRI